MEVSWRDVKYTLVFCEFGLPLYAIETVALSPIDIRSQGQPHPTRRVSTWELEGLGKCTYMCTCIGFICWIECYWHTDCSVSRLNLVNVFVAHTLTFTYI